MQSAEFSRRASFQQSERKALRYGSLQTPIGMVSVGVSDYGVYNLNVIDSNNTGSRVNHGFVKDVLDELNEYFFGSRQHFTVAVDLRAVTDFTLRVLRMTQQIRFGEVLSYSDIAREVGSPRAYRAVGRALSRNPVPIVVPCHRVISHRGYLGGFTLGKLSKSILLQLEGHTKLTE